MASSTFFEKKELFERGVAEVRASLSGRDVTKVPQRECGALALKYESLAALARELCELSRTASSREQYTAYATRLAQRATTLSLLARGKGKTTPDEKRREMLEEFDRRTQDIKKRLRSRSPSELTGTECEALSKKYEKLAGLAKAIAAMARTEADEQTYCEFYERLMCRVAELNAIARKKNKKNKTEVASPVGEAATPKRKSAQEPTPVEEAPEAPKPSEPTRQERIASLAKESERLSEAYEGLIRSYRALEETALSEVEREELAYFVRYFTESAEFFEAVRKKEIQTLSPDEILSLQTK